MGYLRQLAAVERRFLDATPLLLAVVVKQTEGILAENDDGYKVAGSEKCHEEVDNVPHQLKAGHGSEHHHDTSGEDAVDGQ